MKILIKVLVIVFLGFSLCSCGNNEDMNTDTTNNTSKQEDKNNTQDILEEVLNSKREYIDEDGNKSLLNEGEVLGKKIEFNRYGFVDFDQDGNTEMIIELDTEDRLVFHVYDNNVYMYYFGLRSMLTIKKNGLFYASGGADANAIERLKFKEKDYEIEEVATSEDNSFEEFSETYQREERVSFKMLDTSSLENSLEVSYVTNLNKMQVVTTSDSTVLFMAEEVNEGENGNLKELFKEGFREGVSKLYYADSNYNSEVFVPYDNPYLIQSLKATRTKGVYDEEKEIMAIINVYDYNDDFTAKDYIEAYYFKYQEGEIKFIEKKTNLILDDIFK